jgi:hypothetical protein
MQTSGHTKSYCLVIPHHPQLAAAMTCEYRPVLSTVTLRQCRQLYPDGEVICDSPVVCANMCGRDAGSGRRESHQT